MAIVCEACKRKFYDSLIRVCPKKDGEHRICLYCCMKCKHHYKGEAGLWGCKAFDEAKEAEKQKKTASKEEKHGMG